MAAKAEKKATTHNPEQTAEIINLHPDITRIAELAYYKASNRGFEPGHEIDDWLEAEQEVIHHYE
ncbi:DUF2934 domain-containing protein [Methylomonas sp. AM2-LC]|uniref:DUF2934 domain-containing protein n=1 Tax=Methylomonas sp. AM2-LC TaxID=3153301 RepID=UPI0032655221